MSNNDIEGIQIVGEEEVQQKENLDDEYGYEDGDGDDQEPQAGEDSEDNDEEEMIVDEEHGRERSEGRNNGEENSDESGEDSDNDESGMKRKSRTLRRGREQDDEDDDDDDDEDESEEAQLQENIQERRRKDQEEEEEEEMDEEDGRVRREADQKDKEGASDDGEEEEDEDDDMVDEEDVANDEGEDKQDEEATEKGEVKMQIKGNVNNNRRRKKNEFWKQRHKGKDGKWLPIQPVAGQGAVQTSVMQRVEESDKVSTTAVQEQQLIVSTKKWDQSNYRPKFEQDDMMASIIERAMKFNSSVLNQKQMISEIVKQNEEIRHASRATLLENHPSSKEFETAPMIVVTENGYKYLTNVSSFCQKGVVEEFIHKNVQIENIDCLGDLLKKSALPKKKSLKKKPAKKHTFGADLYEQE